MKKITTFILLILIISVKDIYSQEIKKKQSLLQTKKEMNQLLNGEFSKIITGNEFSNFGRFISIGTKDKTLKLSGVTVDSLSIWSYNISAGSSNGLASVFDGFELNTSVSAGFTYNRIINLFSRKVLIDDTPTIVSTNEISRDNSVNNWAKNEKEKIQNKYKLDTLEIINEKELIQAKYKLIALRKKIKKLKNKNTTALTSNNSLLNDSIKYATNKAIHDSVLISKQIRRLSTSDYKRSELKKAKSNYQNGLKKIRQEKIKKSKVRNLDLTWFSIGYGFDNNSFNLFDGTKPISEQIIKKDYLSHQFNIALSRYKNTLHWTSNYYWTFGVKLNFTDNLSQLNKRDLVDTEVISTSPLREVKNKKVVYVGEYKEGVERAEIFFDYYKFIGSDNFVAIHFNPKTISGTALKPVTSIHTGLLFPIRKSLESTFINVEVFYKFNDVFDNQNNKESILHRNTFGINATFPIKFNSKK